MRSHEFSVHSTLLEYHSQDFAEELQKRRITETLTLPDISPEVTAMFVHWLYTDTVEIPKQPVGRAIPPVGADVIDE